MKRKHESVTAPTSGFAMTTADNCMHVFNKQTAEVKLEDQQVEEEAQEIPSCKKQRLVDAQLRILRKIPTLQQYHRQENGRRGAIDVGSVGGSTMVNALQETLEETSLVPPAPTADHRSKQISMVAALPMSMRPSPPPPLPPPLQPADLRQQQHQQARAPLVNQLRSTVSQKADERRPTSKSS